MSSLRMSSREYCSRVQSAFTLMRCALVTVRLSLMEMRLSSTPPLTRMSAGAMASVISKPSARKRNALGNVFIMVKFKGLEKSSDYR